MAYIDYEPTIIYPPVASHDSMCMLLAPAASENLYLERVGVSNAYLYDDLDIPIIMEQPTKSSLKTAHPVYACTPGVTSDGIFHWKNKNRRI